MNFDKYRVLRSLGEGGFGYVVQARHKLTGQMVAIKVLKSAGGEEAQKVERFKREARALVQLVHRNVIPIRDFGRTKKGEFYMVMDYSSGRTLAEIVDEEGPLSIERSLAIFYQILDVLDSAHKQGIIHRDLKPENILIEREEGGGERVRVLDFGLARLQIELGKTSERITREGMILGTPSYMSPEQARGEEDLDHRCDIYSAGLVLYEMLSGRPAFSGRDSMSILLRQAEEYPPRFSRLSHVPTPPRALEKIVFRAIRKDPQERYSSAIEFARALEDFAEKKARLPSPGDLKRTNLAPPRSSSPSPLVFILAGTALVALLFFFLISDFSGPEEKASDLPRLEKLKESLKEANFEEGARLKEGFSTEEGKRKAQKVWEEKREELWKSGEEARKKKDYGRAWNFYLGAYRLGKEEALPSAWKMSWKWLARNSEVKRIASFPPGWRYYSASLLPSGKVLIAGGRKKGKISREGKIFDPSTARWESLSSLHRPRQYHTATILSEGQVLLAGGITSGKGIYREMTSNTLEIFDEGQKIFTRKKLSRARLRHSATFLGNGQVFFGGGWLGSKVRNSYRGVFLHFLEIYSPEKKESRRLKSTLPTPRHNHSSALLPSGQVLLAGGNIQKRGKDHYLSRGLIYHPQKKSILQVGKLNHPRIEHSLLSLPDGKVILWGGKGESSPLEAEIYHPQSQSFQLLKTPFPFRKTSDPVWYPQGVALVFNRRRPPPGTPEAIVLAKAGQLYFPHQKKAAPFHPQKGEFSPRRSLLLPSGEILLFYEDKLSLLAPRPPFDKKWIPLLSKINGQTAFPCQTSWGDQIEIEGENLAILGEKREIRAFLVRLGSLSSIVSSTAPPRCFFLPVLSSQKNRLQLQLPDREGNPPGPYLLFITVAGVAGEGKVLQIK